MMLQRHPVQVYRFCAHELPAAFGEKAPREMTGVNGQAGMTG